MKKSQPLARPRGTQDILPTNAWLYQKIQETSQKILNRAGYQPVIFPSYEYQSLFTFSLGESSEVVQKEMFVFNDRKDRKMALRPEGTASVVRLVCQNQLVRTRYPLRLYYWANMFRYERPQKGRYREFWQLGVELINFKGLIAEEELFWLIKQIIQAFKLEKKTLLHWNYLGEKETRQKYKRILKQYLAKKTLCADCQKRYQLNILRVLDCKICQFDFPSYRELLSAQELAYLESLKKILDNLAINHSYNQYLVRGLDYYTGLVFELSLIDKPAVLLGGGRYNQLFSELGKTNLPAAGFALGIDRLANYLLSQEILAFTSDLLFLAFTESAYLQFFFWREKLTDYRIILQLISSTKELFSAISYYSPKLVIIVGQQELAQKQVLIKDWRAKKEFIISQDQLVSWISAYLA